MKQDCKKVLDHISRLEGQLRRLKKDIEAGEPCSDIVQLALSTTKSFDTLRVRMIETFVADIFAQKKKLTTTELDQLEQVYRLVKA